MVRTDWYLARIEGEAYLATGPDPRRERTLKERDKEVFPCSHIFILETNISLI